MTIGLSFALTHQSKLMLLTNHAVGMLQLLTLGSKVSTQVQNGSCESHKPVYDILLMSICTGCVRWGQGAMQVTAV